FVVELMQFTFKRPHSLQSSIPASFQFCGNQPLIWIDGFVSPSCQTCFVASLLELQLNSSAQIASLLLHLLRSFQGGLNRISTDCLQHLFRHGRINSQAAKGNARPLTIPAATSIAHVTNECARIKNLQHSSATSATQKTGNQGSSATPGLRLSTRVHMRIGSNHRLISFILVPGKVPWMMLLDQDLPFALWLAVACRFTCTALYNLGPFLGFAVRVGTCVDWLGEDRV